MRHLLMDPAFPDIVGAWAAEAHVSPAARPCPRPCNDDYAEHDYADPLLDLLGRLEIDATRVW
jgi:hypothetical protein